MFAYTDGTATSTATGYNDDATSVDDVRITSTLSTQEIMYYIRKIGKEEDSMLFLDPLDYRELRSESRIREQRRLQIGMARGKNARVAHIKKIQKGFRIRSRLY